MDNGYFSKLKEDLVEQFRDKPNLEMILSVIGEQMDDISHFFQDLKHQRSVSLAVGTQLDGVGDIAVLSRGEARGLSSFTSSEDMDDESYRIFLWYKIWKNSNICTYYDILKSFQMFWTLPLYYREELEEPATMILSTDVLTPEDNAYQLLSAPVMKAAGVKIYLEVITQYEEMVSELYTCPQQGGIYAVTEIPYLGEEFSL